MTIEKAIELLQDLLLWSPDLSKTDAGSATKLGIEALKQERRLRINNRAYRGHTLPGETPE